MNIMNWKKSMLFFGIPGAWITINFLTLLPWLLDKGMPMFFSTTISLFIPIVALLIFIYIDYRKSNSSLSSFLWIKKLTKKEILICFALFILVQLGELALSGSREWLAGLPGFQVPSFFPDLFKPDYEIQIPLETFFGMKLKGNYPILFLWAGFLILNIGGEELLWRGYALKRMEKYFGKWAWLVNGLLWNLFIHFFMRWSFIGLLPVSLVVPYICQKTKSLWPGVIIHGTGNLILYALLIPSIF
jgi:membrane protease YdiL (CAAX protease family)